MDIGRFRRIALVWVTDHKIRLNTKVGLTIFFFETKLIPINLDGNSLGPKKKRFIH